MKLLHILFLVFALPVFAQDIRSIQLFNPKTNDETPVIDFDSQLVLRFDDLSNGSEIYRYTIKHFDRNWQDDGLFFTEFAKGSMSGMIDRFEYSFNTYQKYTHYELTFPNEKLRPVISGNFELIVYKDSADKPLFTRKFCVVENNATVGVAVSRTSVPGNPTVNQRIEVQAISNGNVLSENVSSVSLNVIQNNNWGNGRYSLKPSSSLGNRLLFQQLDLTFEGNNEFYYFNNKVLDQAYDMIASTGNSQEGNQTFLHPVWAYPLNYQYQPDVDGAFYFRRSDAGIERDANKEGDYSWVYFYLESDPFDKDIYVLGCFNQFQPSEESKMRYDADRKMYEAKIYLKQGFYNYILATDDGSGVLNYGEINGSFWQTENLYQAFLYYQPFGRNYDGLAGYGEYRQQNLK